MEEIFFSGHKNLLNKFTKNKTSFKILISYFPKVKGLEKRNSGIPTPLVLQPQMYYALD